MMKNSTVILSCVLLLAIGFVIYSPGPRNRYGKDLFAEYYGYKQCGLSSQQVYAPDPSQKFCKNSAELLMAMSSGGRHGFDAVYQSRGCNHRWYTHAEICDILERFSMVLIVGDSIARGVHQGVMAIARANLAYGGLKNWEYATSDDLDACSCERQLLPYVEIGDDKRQLTCSFGLYVENATTVVEHDPSSWSCPTDNLMMKYALKEWNPLMVSDFTDVYSTLKSQSDKPIATILIHGIHANLDIEESIEFIDGWIGLTGNRGSFNDRTNFPALWFPPSAGGEGKPEQYWGPQGLHALWRYEQETKKFAEDRGLDVLNTWNLTIQSSSYDGTHHGLLVNMEKGMMIFNWLDAISRK